MLFQREKKKIQKLQLYVYLHERIFDIWLQSTWLYKNKTQPKKVCNIPVKNWANVGVLSHHFLIKIQIKEEQNRYCMYTTVFKKHKLKKWTKSLLKLYLPKYPLISSLQKTPNIMNSNFEKSLDYCNFDMLLLFFSSSYHPLMKKNFL